MFISFFCVGVGLCFMIGWFDQSLNYLTDNFFYIEKEEETQHAEDPLQTILSSQVVNASGHRQSLREIKGQVTLLSFWASWCGPCRVELPTLADLHKTFKDQGLQIVAINLDSENTNEVTSLWNTMELPFSFFSDFEGQTAKAFNVQSLPVHFVLNQYGEVMLTANGANDWSHPRNMQMFQDFLNQ